MLKQKKIEFLGIESRVKTTKSALEKIERKEYKNPSDQMTDLSGIRIITYLEQQVNEVADVVKELFEVDGRNSLDRTEILGDDKVGYRSTHFVCSLGKEREKLPENRLLGELKFEVQVRTVLQHAWAELAHDRAFKFKASLPPKIERKLNLYAGMLEVIDGAFDEIAKDIDSYKLSLSKKTLEQLSSVGIDTISVERFIKGSTSENGIKLSKPHSISLAAIENIKNIGVQNIGELEAIITPQFVKDYKEYIGTLLGPAGYIRLLLMYYDLDWVMNNRTWSWIPRQVVSFLKSKYGESKIDELIKAHKLDIEDSAFRPKRPPIKRGK